MTAARKPWLSVVLPVHHGEEWVGAALDSLASQADDGIEIVVIDTSADGQTRAIMEAYGDRLQLRFVDPAGAEGCMGKTNRGVAEARADHIAWLCQDDVWLPGRTAAVRRWIEADDGAVLHLAPSVIIDASGRHLGIWRCPLSGDGELQDREALLQRFLVQNFASVVSLIVRRDAWLAVGALDPSLWYTADWDLWLKLVRHGPVRFHDDVTGGFRIHPQATTVHGARGRNEFMEQQQIVVRRHAGALSEREARRLLPLASASARINTDLAAVARGNWIALLRVAGIAIGLGPAGLVRYLEFSRIVDRTLPRVRARLAGVF